MRNLVVAPVLVFALVASAACITYQAIPVAEIGAVIKPGNRVIITTYEGDELTLDVQAIDLVGRDVVAEDRQVPFDDIALIEQRRFTLGGTTKAIGTTTLVLAGLLALLLLAAFGAA